MMLLTAASRVARAVVASPARASAAAMSVAMAVSLAAVMPPAVNTGAYSAFCAAATICPAFLSELIQSWLLVERLSLGAGAGGGVGVGSGIISLWLSVYG